MLNHSFIERLSIVFGLAVIAVIVVALLAGCSTVSNYGLKTINTIEQANDQSLAVAEKAYCDGPTDGALTRRYGENPEIQKARNELCSLIRMKTYNR